MKRFELHRHEDETGISGTGHIADGVEFDDGTVAIRWRTSNPGTTMFASLDHARKVHGHAGKTAFVFRDQRQENEREIYFCTMCFAECDIAAHCFNCGAGGTNISIPEGHMKLIRKNASWVGRRFYPGEEDKELYEERSALRKAIGSWPGRSIEAIPESDDVWIKQAQTDGRYVMISAARRGRSDAEIIEQTAADLPWVPGKT